MTRLSSTAFPAAQLRVALRTGALDDLPDSDLLTRFALYGEHAAFEVLLRRHGPMVFGVCRRTLVNVADAEDAFQAVFLVLVRKARSVRGERLGPWLYGVAYRVAMKARGRELRVALRRSEATDMIPDPTPPVEVPDWLPVLDAELNALPAKYREPLVLCELQGASRGEAAKALGIPEGTLSSRLSRGRELLRRRLLKHGTLLPAGGLAALFTSGGIGRAALPATLLAKTAQLAAVVSTGAAPVGAVPAGAAQLTDEVLKSMFLTKLRVAVGAVLALGLLTIGALAALPTEAPAQVKAKDKDAKPVAKEKDAKAQPVKPAGPVLPDRDAMQGLWVLDKYETGKGVRGDEERQAKELVGKMQFLVAGDVWWGLMLGGPPGVSAPSRVKLDPSKNPKWIDIGDGSRGGDVKAIYELDGDTLRICIANGGNSVRPAEFNLEDDVPLLAMHFRREKLPPVASDKKLLGNWVGGEKSENKKTGEAFANTVVILDSHIFLRSTTSREADWFGGKYTVDTTKNPNWIDIELTGPLQEQEKVTKLYGCYEVVDGKLKLALGAKRATRPLEFASGNDVLLFDLGVANDSRPVYETSVRENAVAPAPRSK